ncbi:hypothetical protein IEQ34_010554 [Dendrobium chrysotoxum]|uniref:Uncharacterized protein n=1 Tax=Dendrobium chrysotoxum TaxID=161865 RepID=A0AAV7GV49_DENCH|nr:hypothetical protein IEQ34_010554 [Dendrobium chrysotoxum]
MLFNSFMNVTCKGLKVHSSLWRNTSIRSFKPLCFLLYCKFESGLATGLLFFLQGSLLNTLIRLQLPFKILSFSN